VKINSQQLRSTSHELQQDNRKLGGMYTCRNTTYNNGSVHASTLVCEYRTMTQDKWSLNVRKVGIFSNIWHFRHASTFAKGVLQNFAIILCSFCPWYLQELFTQYYSSKFTTCTDQYYAQKIHQEHPLGCISKTRAKN